MHRLLARTLALTFSLALITVFATTAALAQYQLTTLVTDATDPELINPWGIARSSTGPFWVSDNVTGFSTLYDGMGNKQSLVVTVPPAAGGTFGQPSGIVFNGGTGFIVSKNGKSGAAAFIFSTTDGTISGWSPTVDPNNAVLVLDNSKNSASYTGLAISKNNDLIYAADGANNVVDVYDTSFNLVNTFTDPNVRAGFAVYGIQDINGKVYVTFASVSNGGGGVIDIFTENGVLKLHTSSQHMNQPWGIALAPNNFGKFSNDLLVGNNTPTGQINAYDPKTGAFLGTLQDSTGNTLKIDQLWGIEFGGGSPSNGNTNQLFFTAGTMAYAGGTFGVINSLN
jgi:uncharacterized protein (TIGR03118 family)